MIGMNNFISLSITMTSTNNSSKNDKDWGNAMEKRRADAMKFFWKSPRYSIKVLSPEEIKKMWSWELMFLTMIWRMWSSSYYFTVSENNNIEYFSTDWYYTNDWFKAIIDTYKWLEDYSDENLMAAFRKEYDFKNYNFVDTGFWTWLFVSKKIFSEINDFIKTLSVTYGTDVDFFFWYDWIEVSKIYFSDNKELFLSSISK